MRKPSYPCLMRFQCCALFLALTPVCTSSPGNTMPCPHHACQRRAVCLLPRSVCRPSSAASRPTTATQRVLDTSLNSGPTGTPERLPADQSHTSSPEGSVDSPPQLSDEPVHAAPVRALTKSEKEKRLAVMAFFKCLTKPLSSLRCVMRNLSGYACLHYSLCAFRALVLHLACIYHTVALRAAV